MQNRNFREFINAVWQKMRGAIASPWVRRHRSWLFQAYVLFTLLAFSALAFMANTTTYFDFDLYFSREIQAGSPPLFGLLLQAISWPGYAVPAIAIVSLVVIFLGMAGLRWEALAVIFAVLTSGAVNYLIKIAIRRPRPTEDLVEVFQTLNTYSFPSGHVMFYTTFFGFLLFLAYTMLNRSIKRLILLIFLAMMIALVGMSRLYVGEHWASDVVAGYLLGSLMLILSIQFYQWGKERFIIDQPVAPTDDFDHSSAIPVTSDEAEEDEHSPDRTRPKQRF
jgi:membrane-associated phospholipid phosphatase